MIGAISDNRPNCRAVKAIRWTVSALGRILSRHARGSIGDNSSFTEDGQNSLSATHSSYRCLPLCQRSPPSGDGIAYRMYWWNGAHRRSPSSVTLSMRYPFVITQETRASFHLRPILFVNPFHPFTTSHAFSQWMWSGVESSLVGPLATMARCEPSGDKLQLQSGSICEGAVLFPTPHIKLERFRSISPLNAYRQTVDGKCAHCTFQMPTS